MMSSLKSEIRKIITVRSTYVIILISLVLIGLISFYSEGYKADPRSLHDSGKLALMLAGTITNVAGLGAIVAILLMTHEYRYNTIIYTLTSAKSRLSVLASKVIAVSIFSLLYTAFMILASTFAMYIGVSMAGHSLSHQIVHTSLYGQMLFAGWASCMYALILSLLLKHQVGVIAVYFFGLGVVEGMLSLFLKANSAYLPMTAIQHTVQGAVGGFGGLTPAGYGPTQAMLTVLAYVVSGFAASYLVFTQKDAN